MSTASSEVDRRDDLGRPSLFRRVDLVVLLLILLLTAAFLLPASATVRDCSIRLQCINHLKQLGLGIHNYHNVFNSFPNPDVPPLEEIATAGGKIERKPHTIYADLLPFVEERSDDWQKHPPQVRIYLCPSRRSFASSEQTAAPDDYAIGIHPDWFGPQTTAPFGAPPNGYPPAKDAGSVAGTTGWYSILGGCWTRTAVAGVGPCRFPGTTLGQVTDLDGSSYTLLMAHKGMAPSQYAGGSPTDLGWNIVAPDTKTLVYEHMRCPFGAVHDFNGNRDGAGADVPFCDESVGPTPQSANSMDWLLGSPHPGAMPCLFADGGVRNIVYGSPRDPDPGTPAAMSPHLWAKLWAFNDSLSLNNAGNYVEEYSSRGSLSVPRFVTDYIRDLPMSAYVRVLGVAVCAGAFYIAVVAWLRPRRRTNAAR